VQHDVAGNTTDVTSLVPGIRRLQEHFGIQRVGIVAHRGMISDATTFADVEARGWLYILGVRMRRTREARDEVLSRSGRFQIVHAKGDDIKAPSPLQVKEVWISDQRYVVCRNANDLKEIELTVQGKGYRLRTETRGTLSAVFGACGVALPPQLPPV